MVAKFIRLLHAGDKIGAEIHYSFAGAYSTRRVMVFSERRDLENHIRFLKLGGADTAEEQCALDAIIAAEKRKAAEDR